MTDRLFRILKILEKYIRKALNLFSYDKGQ